MEKEAALEQTLKPNWGQKSCQKRLDIIDVMQGIAMLWVIVGHHLFDFMPPVYGHIHYYIYSFHMPLFIFISGFLIAYSYKGISYRQYVYRRFHKFFVPYVIVGIIITLLAATKGGIASIGENLVNLMVSPKQSEATFLWYIYLLFVLYAIFPFCEKGRKKLGISFEVLLLLIGICFYLFPIGTTILCLDYFSGYFLFYAIGVVAAWHFGFIKRHLSDRFCRIVGNGIYATFALWIYCTVFYSNTCYVYYFRHGCEARRASKTYTDLHIKKLFSYILGAHVFCASRGNGVFVYFS